MLFFLTFQGEEFRGENWMPNFSEFVAFSVFGLFLWTLAGLFYWNGVLVPRFRALTGRTEDAKGKRATPPPLPRLQSPPVDEASAVHDPIKESI